MNVSELPKVSVADIKQLPDTPCVYFVLSPEGETLYVGSTVNLRNRWFYGRHHRMDQAEQEKASIAWISTDKDDLLEQEDHFIQSLSPPWNGLNHGGQRTNAGRKTGWRKPNTRTIMTMIKVNATERALAQTLGDGNASLGVRRALYRATQQDDHLAD